MWWAGEEEFGPKCRNEMQNVIIRLVISGKVNKSLAKVGGGE